MQEEELVRKVARRDEDAFCELLRLYAPLIKAIVRYHLKMLPMWQEDCINDVYFSLWRNITRFDPEKNSLKNWIGAVAKYRAIDYKRKYVFSEEYEESGAEDKAFLKRELEEETRELLGNLSAEDREIFVRRYIMDENIDDISRAVGKKSSAVYNRLSRGRRKLREIYGKRV